MLPANEITLLLAGLQNGEQDSGAKLAAIIYAELHRLAGHYMRNERSGHTLQATALVNEVYLKLVDQKTAVWESRAHFIGVAAQIMRHILIDHARSRQTAKHGGLRQQVTLNEALVYCDEQSTELLSLDQALKRLSQMDARQSRIVELRYFGGLSVEETSLVLGISPKTVKRDWVVARAWLRREMSSGGS